MDKRRIIIEIEVEKFADNQKISHAVKEWLKSKFKKHETSSIIVETIGDLGNSLIK